MSASTLTLPRTATNSPSRTLRLYANETRFEFLRLLRTRAFSLSVIGFPLMFYGFFGVLMNRGDHIGSVDVAKYMLGGYAAFGALGAALFGIGVGLANDLAAGWLELKRASPMPPLAYLLAKMLAASAFSVLIVTLLTVLGISCGHVHLPLTEFARMVGLAAIAAIPFSCLGLALALLVPPASAGGIANIVYLPMSYCSGLWVPFKFLPHVIQTIAPALPTFHLAQLMLGALGAPTSGTSTAHWANLLGFTLLMLGIAWIAFKRREQNA